MDYGRQTASQVLDELPIGVWVARAPSGEVLYSNRAFRNIVGIDGVPGIDIAAAPAAYRIFDRQGRPYPARELAFSRAVEGGEPVVVDDIIIHRADGGRAWVRAFANPIRDGNGVVTHVVVTFTDITAEVRAVVERAEVEKHLAVAIHHAPVLFFTMDKAGVLTVADGALKPVIEGGRHRMVGSSIFELYKHHPTVPGNVRRALAGETVSYSVEVAGLSLDVWLGPLRDAAGEIAGAIGVCTDVTESRKLQSRIIQEDRVHAIGTLAASVAHEINNPLTYVLVGIEETGEELAALAADLDAVAAAPHDRARLDAARTRLARAREALGPPRAGTERIRGITRELSTFTRPDDEHLALVDLATVARSVLNLVRKEIEARARLVEELGPSPLVRANEARLVQVLVNLLMNAWQALPSPDPATQVIGVRTARQAETGEALVEIWDSGPGVPPELRARIFDPFVTTKEIGAGTGLGLFVCRNVVKSFQGTVTVHDAPGGGALFRVALPAARSVLAPEAASAPAPSPREDRRRAVLIIDDDAQVARALATRIAGGPFEVRTVHDGRAGLELLLAEQGPDLVYCDLMMNGFSGMDLYEVARGRSPERAARVVFMSGGAFTREARTFVAERRAEFVQKPFDILEDARARLGVT